MIKLKCFCTNGSAFQWNAFYFNSNAFVYLQNTHWTGTIYIHRAHTAHIAPQMSHTSLNSIHMYIYADTRYYNNNLLLRSFACCKSYTTVHCTLSTVHTLTYIYIKMNRNLIYSIFIRSQFTYYLFRMHYAFTHYNTETESLLISQKLQHSNVFQVNIQYTQAQCTCD